MLPADGRLSKNHKKLYIVIMYDFLNYSKDSIKAVDAKFEAQKIAFAPLAFQAVRSLLEFGVLQAVSDSGDNGLTIDEIIQKTKISEYAAKVLIEMALGLNVIKLSSNEQKEERFVLGKIGWFLLEDEMTKVNLNFVNDVCYKGAFDLLRSLKDGKPAGLEVFNTGKKTIYEALSILPENVKKSWFEFDHFYSDISFPEALPIVFANKPKKIIDIGGNTAKWAICCCRYDSEVEVTIVDLPGQTHVAQQNAAAAGFENRIKTAPCNVLDNETAIPKGADAIMMSQFLDCFSLEEITRIMTKVKAAAGPSTDVYIMEPFWDKQRFEAAAFSLQATSLYFTCMANGNSKMYRYEEFARTIENAGFVIADAHHDLGSNDYSLLRCRSKE